MKHSSVFLFVILLLFVFLSSCHNDPSSTDIDFVGSGSATIILEDSQSKKIAYGANVFIIIDRNFSKCNYFIIQGNGTTNGERFGIETTDRIVSLDFVSYGDYNVTITGLKDGKEIVVKSTRITIAPYNLSTPSVSRYRIGQAGGFVFYDCDADNLFGNDDGLISSECGWRFLEVTPFDIEYFNKESRYERIFFESSEEALAVCDNFEYGGFDDWYLPSRNDLLYICENVFHSGLSSPFSAGSSYLASDGSYNDYDSFLNSSGPGLVRFIRKIEVLETGHYLSKHPYVAPTCISEGSSEYWECYECGKLFSDPLGTHEITESDTVIPAAPTLHTPEEDKKVFPTHTETGLTAGSHCIVCGQILVPQETIGTVPDNEYAVGDIGPAGGIIIFDNGEYTTSTYFDSSGNEIEYQWRYLEMHSEITEETVPGGSYGGVNHSGDKGPDEGYILPYGLCREDAEADCLFVNGLTKYDESTCTRKGIGEGRRNTSLLANAFDQFGCYRSSYIGKKLDNPVAKIVSEYTITFNETTFDDWFLPSLEEYLYVCDYLLTFFDVERYDYENGSVFFWEKNRGFDAFMTSSEIEEDARFVYCIEADSRFINDEYKRLITVREVNRSNWTPVRPIRAF